MIIKQLLTTVIALSLLMILHVSALSQTRSPTSIKQQKTVNLSKQVQGSTDSQIDYGSLTLIKTLDVRNYIWKKEDIGIDAIVFSPDGKVIAIAISKQTIGPGFGHGRLVLWDLETSRVRAIMPEAGWRYSAAFSPDGKTLATASRDVKLWDMRTGKLLRNYGEGMSVAISHDGKIIAGGGYGCSEPNCGEDPPGAIRVWDIQTGALKHTIEGITSVVFSVAFSPDDMIIAGNSGGYDMWIWDTKNWNLLRKLKPNFEIYSPLVFSPDGKIIAIGGGVPEGNIGLWDALTGKLLRALSANKLTDELVTSVAFAPDGSTVAGADTGQSIKLWSLKTGEVLRTLSGHGTAAFSPDGKLLVTGTKDGTIRIWGPGK